jgi:hypothetical protein
MSTHRKISRRTWLKGMAVFSAAAGACQVVEGRISPMGYCDLYIPA